MNKLSIVKIGGNIIDHPEDLSRFLQEFAQLDGLKVLVHGGGKLASVMAGQLGIEVEMVDGRRITNRETLDVVTMVYGGRINKTMVAMLQARHCNAIGLSGADGNLIVADKRPAGEIDYGFAGDVRRVNDRLLTELLNSRLVPVVAPLTHDGEGNLLNTNADTIASQIAISLAAHYTVSLIYAFDKPGVLTAIDSDSSVVSLLSEQVYQRWKSQGVIAGGMIPKLDNGFGALSGGVQLVRLCHADKVGTAKTGTELCLK